MLTLKTLVGTCLALGLLTAGADAAGGSSKYKIVEQDWTFSGPFGKFDAQQLQRGFKVYREVCAACHSIELVRFRNLGEEGGPLFSEDEIKQIASEYIVVDGVDDFGDPKERAGLPSDAIPSPYPNRQAAAAANGGKYPPDFSLLAKARATKRGFPTFVFDPFTTYAESGPDYIYGLLTGYAEPSEEALEDAPDGLYYNTGYSALHGSDWFAMPQILYDDQVEYTDGSPMTLSQYSKDVAAFMMWAAEPHLNQRKRMGFQVLMFLVVFSGLLWFTKKKLWANIDH